MCPNRCNNFIENSFNNNFTNDTTDTAGLAANSEYTLPVNSMYSFPSTIRYGSAYVPVQTFRTVYTPANGLANGTMFPELVRQYSPNQSLAEMEYLRNYRESGCRR